MAPLPPQSPPPTAPPPGAPVSDVFCGAANGYELVLDFANGDKCVGAGDAATNWTAPAGCQDSIDNVPSLNGAGLEPRVLVNGCGSTQGRTVGGEWSCGIQSVARVVIKEWSTVVFHNGRGGSIQVNSIRQWGYNGNTIKFSMVDSTRSPNEIFGAGDTVYVRRTARPAATPHSVLVHSSTACQVSTL